MANYDHLPTSNPIFLGARWYSCMLGYHFVWCLFQGASGDDWHHAVKFSWNFRKLRCIVQQMKSGSDLFGYLAGKVESWKTAEKRHLTQKRNLQATVNYTYEWYAYIDIFIYTHVYWNFPNILRWDLRIDQVGKAEPQAFYGNSRSVDFWANMQKTVTETVDGRNSAPPEMLIMGWTTKPQLVFLAGFLNQKNMFVQCF